MRKNYLNSRASAPQSRETVDFDMEIYQPSPETIEIYNELSAISEEIEKCRNRNCR